MARVDDEHRAFSEPLTRVAAPYQAGARLAAYLLWSNLVDPQGYLKRTAMFMSKNLMVGIWSWDHGFNAMALANSPSLSKRPRGSQGRTYSRTIERALEDFVRRAQARQILELAGSGLWQGDLSQMRENRSPSAQEE